MAESEIRYTRTELRSFLPTGWSVDEDAFQGWSPERGAWVTTLRDGSDLPWEVSVPSDAVAANGRVEALGKAVRNARGRW